MLTTNQKGAIAETAIAHEAIKLGIEVYRPVVEGGRFDLIFAFEDASLARVQCKYAPIYRGVIIVRCESSRRTADGFRRRSYTADEIDALAAYCPQLETCYFLPIEFFEGRSHISLRLGPTRNSQRAGVNWAASYEFAATLGRVGAVAQLGERRAGSA